MAKQFLWARAWPWYLPAFPFHEFDELDGEQLSTALQECAQKWITDNRAALLKARLDRMQEYARRRMGTPISTHRFNPRVLGDAAAEANGREATFEEAARCAGWTRSPRGLIVVPPDRCPVMPTERCWFYEAESEVLADMLLDVLRRTTSRLEADCGFGSGNAEIRFGRASEATFDAAGLLIVMDATTVFWRHQYALPHWRGRIADRIRRTIEAMNRQAMEQRVTPDDSTIQPQDSEELADAEHVNVFRREGDYWTITFDGQTARCRHRHGMQYIQVLLEHAGQRVPVEDFDLTPMQRASLATKSQEVVPKDERIRMAKQMASIRADLAMAEEEGDVPLRDELSAELRALEQALGEAHGIGALPRTFSDPRDKLRKRVGAALSRAMDSAQKAHNTFGMHLRACIDDPGGKEPAYLPSPGVAWFLGS